MPANGACLLLALGSLKALKAFETLLMKDMGATEDGLLLETKVLIADGAWFLIIEPFE